MGLIWPIRLVGWAALALALWQVDIHIIRNPAFAYYARIVNLTGIAIIMAVGLNIINGTCGQFSIGHAGFMAIGAYTAGYVSKTYGSQISQALGLGSDVTVAGAAALIMLVTLVAACITGAISGFVVGLPALRLRGDYLAIATLGFGEIIRVGVSNVDALGAATGMTGIPETGTFVWIGLVAVACVTVSRNLMQTGHGRALLAIREDEIAAEAMGVNTTLYKVRGFTLGAIFAAAAGALYAQWNAFIAPTDFDFMRSFDFVMMVVIGGSGSITGSIVAAVILTYLPEALRFAKDWRLVAFSQLLILIMLTRPEGIFGTREFSLKDPLGLFRHTGTKTLIPAGIGWLGSIALCLLVASWFMPWATVEGTVQNYLGLFESILQKTSSRLAWIVYFCPIEALLFSLTAMACANLARRRLLLLTAGVMGLIAVVGILWSVLSHANTFGIARPLWIGFYVSSASFVLMLAGALTVRRLGELR